MFFREAQINPSQQMKDMHQKLVSHISIRIFQHALWSQNMKK